MHKPQEKLSFFAKFKKGLVVSLKSIKFTWNHKKLNFFPLMTVLIIASSVGIYDVVFYQLYDQHITSFLLEEEQSTAKEESTKRPTEKPETILFYCVMLLVSIFSLAFFNVALSYAASQVFFEEPVDIGKSISHSVKKLPTILVWTFAAFFVRLLLNVLTSKDKKGNSSFLARLVGEAAELAWYMATFLVVPVIAHENIGAFKSIRVSAHLFKKTFGENVAANLLLQGGIPLIIFFVAAACMLLAIFLSIALHTIISPAIILTPALVFILLMAVISWVFVSAAIMVFKTAVYHYALGKPVGPFGTKEIESSFVADSKEKE